MKVKVVCGIVLACLMLSSALLAVLGIWGALDSAAVWKMLGTFAVVGATTVGVSYVANSFFNDKP